jgi:hypothetical protein
MSTRPPHVATGGVNLGADADPLESSSSLPKLTGVRVSDTLIHQNLHAKE